MEAYQAIVSKRDTRDYASRPIPDDVLQRILQAGRMAGSSKNTQPVRFVVVQDSEQKSTLAACGNFAKHMPGAPLAIAVVLEPDGGAFDAGRSAQNMMVVAWAEGITSCPTSMHNADCAREVLGLPDGHSVQIVLAMGYLEQGASINLGRERLPHAELVHWERWGG